MTLLKKAVLVCALIGSSAAYGKSEPFLACELALGHVVSVQVHMPKDPSYPTFLLLPGLNRSILLSDPAVQHLIRDGAGAITMNFSVQPFSLNIGSTPPPDAEVTLASLAAEVEAVADMAIERLGLTTVIPVSLSYTGAVSTRLERFPLIIDTVPLTSARAHEPALYLYRHLMNQMAQWNPFAASQVNYMWETYYRAHWAPHVYAAIRAHSLSPHLAPDMIDGYAKLSRAVENFDWRDNSPHRDVTRVFVLAENESSALLKDQLAVIAAMKADGFKVATIIIAKSGHILPMEQPEIFALVLKAAAKGLIQPGTSSYIRASHEGYPHIEGDHFDFSNLSGED